MFRTKKKPGKLRMMMMMMMEKKMESKLTFFIAANKLSQPQAAVPLPLLSIPSHTFTSISLGRTRYMPTVYPCSAS